MPMPTLMLTTTKKVFKECMSCFIGAPPPCLDTLEKKMSYFYTLEYKLYNHQREAIEWMLKIKGPSDCRNNVGGGILGLGTGGGKTLTCLVLSLAMNIRDKADRYTHSPTLIVVPNGVTTWAENIEDFTNLKKKDYILFEGNSRKYITKEQINYAVFVIVPYSVLASEHKKYL